MEESPLEKIEEKEKELVEDKSGKINEEELIRIRKEKIINFFKKNYNWVAYLVLAFIVYLAVKIRTSNLGGLKDITTGTWTLGPDLDPFLFLRWAKYIVEHGTLFAVDNMRYVPLGFNTKAEYLLLPYSIAWFYKYLGWTFGAESVTHSAVIYPVFMFALTIIAFFFMTRKFFIKNMGEINANIIALISSFFLSVMPSLLPRTIAGIPEKESAAFLFLFLSFYFFISAWEAKKDLHKYILATLAGLSTAGMANIWGGYQFIFVVLSPSIFIAFIFNKIGKKEFYVSALWVVSSLTIISITRFSLKAILSSYITSSSIAVLLVILVDYAIFSTNLKKYFQTNRLKKIPPKIVSSVISVAILIILASMFFGINFVHLTIQNIYDSLVKPVTSRLIQTVAENRQPYFTEWANSFGPYFRNIPVTFWLFFIGSIYLFYNIAKIFKQNERITLTLAYLFFLISLIFSRYSPNISLNGESNVSLFLYALGFVVFISTFAFYYYRYYKKEEMEKLKQINLGIIILFSFFFLSIVAARAAVRTIMMLVPPVSVIIAYFAVDSFNRAKKANGDFQKVVTWIFSGLIIISSIFAGYGFYNAVNASAQEHIPSVYTQQWQKAMGWVRENTPKDAVFGHWWDYGYWLQSIGERATVLDGGNAQGYWNHLMGRHGLTSPNTINALEFLYTHNTTHFLIDSTDIGKYSAFSSIGSDENYDRASFIPTLGKNYEQSQEKKNSTVFVYPAGFGLDGDIVYDDNGTKIFLPAGRAGIGAILIEKDKSGKIAAQPRAAFVYENKQYNLPLRYVYNKEFIDFGSGVEAGVFLFPNAIQSQGNIQIDPDGAMLYLSPRVAKSQLARLYLYKEDNHNFKLIHSEDDYFVSLIKQQNPGFDSDFINYGGFRGPIRIWEINYPEDIKFKEEYLSTDYPHELTRLRQKE